MRAAAVATAAWFSVGSAAGAAEPPVPVTPQTRQTEVIAQPSVWDLLPLGRPFSDLPTNGYVNLACGTAGGPPSLPLGGWWDYAKCQADPETNLHEVYFEYDDLYLYEGLATYTTAKSTATNVLGEFPAVVSALFTDDGFLGGIRVFTDARASTDDRLRAHDLLYYLLSTVPGVSFVCSEAPLAPGTVDSR